MQAQRSPLHRAHLREDAGVTGRPELPWFSPNARLGGRDDAAQPGRLLRYPVVAIAQVSSIGRQRRTQS